MTTKPLPGSAVEIEALRFSYGDLEVFRDLSLAIPRGKVVSILGGSGVGKSTLLKLIGGQLRPQAGRVVVEGKNVHELDARALYELRLRMGMMLQTSGLFTDLNVSDNVAFPLRENFRIDEASVDRIVKMKLHAVGLRGTVGMKPSDLSGGMTRRIALARAVATDPQLMMYDEPFAGLDPISLSHIGKLIRALNEAIGLTSIVVTYDVKEALKVADYAYMIADGAVLAHGAPKELEASRDPYVRQFLDAQPDGPVRFHFPGATLAEDLGLGKT